MALVVGAGRQLHLRTWQVLRGLLRPESDMNQPWLQKAKRWFESVQRPDGGWGERCNTYDDPVFKGQGPSTASQTAWAVMGLCAFDDPDSPSLRCGIEYLIRTQNADGSWSERRKSRAPASQGFLSSMTCIAMFGPLLALATYKLQAQRPGCGRGNDSPVAGSCVIIALIETQTAHDPAGGPCLRDGLAFEPLVRARYRLSRRDWAAGTIRQLRAPRNQCGRNGISNLGSKRRTRITPVGNCPRTDYEKSFSNTPGNYPPN